MEWVRTSRDKIETEEGYVVCAFRSGSEAFTYCAFAPAVDIKPLMKVRYGMGERVPEKHPHLGCFHAQEPGRGEAKQALASAKQACQEHWERENGKRSSS